MPDTAESFRSFVAEVEKVGMGMTHLHRYGGPALLRDMMAERDRYREALEGVESYLRDCAVMRVEPDKRRIREMVGLALVDLDSLDEKERSGA